MVEYILLYRVDGKRESSLITANTTEDALGMIDLVGPHYWRSRGRKISDIQLHVLNEAVPIPKDLLKSVTSQHTPDYLENKFK